MSQPSACRRESLLTTCVAISEPNSSRLGGRSRCNQAFTALSSANPSTPSTRINTRRTTSETVKKEL